MKRLTFADAQYAGEGKHARKQVTLFALSNMWMAGRHLLTNTGISPDYLLHL